MIERHIARVREDKHVAAREKYAREFVGGGKPIAPTPTAPAPPDANAKAKAKATAKEKATPKPKAKSAAPVLPSPQPKQHAKGKGQGRKGKSKSRSASPREKKQIPCHFHFIKKSCKKGKDCEYSHDQKVFDACKNKSSGKGGGKTPRGQSPANKTKKVNEHCWHWAHGTCKYGDKCNKKHRTPKRRLARRLLLFYMMTAALMNHLFKDCIQCGEEEGQVQVAERRS